MAATVIQGHGGLGPMHFTPPTTGSWRSTWLNDRGLCRAMTDERLPAPLVADLWHASSPVTRCPHLAHDALGCVCHSPGCPEDAGRQRFGRYPGNQDRRLAAGSRRCE